MVVVRDGRVAPVVVTHAQPVDGLHLEVFVPDSQGNLQRVLEVSAGLLERGHLFQGLGDVEAYADGVVVQAQPPGVVFAFLEILYSGFIVFQKASHLAYQFRKDQFGKGRCEPVHGLHLDALEDGLDLDQILEPNELGDHLGHFVPGLVPLLLLGPLLHFPDLLEQLIGTLALLPRGDQPH